MSGTFDRRALWPRRFQLRLWLGSAWVGRLEVRTMVNPTKKEDQPHTMGALLGWVFARRRARRPTPPEDAVLDTRQVILRHQHRIRDATHTMAPLEPLALLHV